MFVEAVCMPRCLNLYTYGHGKDWNTWIELFGWVSEYFLQYSVYMRYVKDGVVLYIDQLVQYSYFYDQLQSSPQHRGSPLNQFVQFLWFCKTDCTLPNRRYETSWCRYWRTLASLIGTSFSVPSCRQPQYCFSSLVCCPGNLPGICILSPPPPLLLRRRQWRQCFGLFLVTLKSTIILFCLSSRRGDCSPLCHKVINQWWQLELH